MYFWENAILGKTNQRNEYQLNDDEEEEKNIYTIRFYLVPNETFQFSI